MSDSLDKVSAVTGLSRTDLKSIHEQVKANQAKLDSCTKHSFTIPVDRRTKEPIPERVFGCSWRCEHCGGNVGITEKMWYALGMLHATR